MACLRTSKESIVSGMEYIQGKGWEMRTGHGLEPGHRCFIDDGGSVDSVLSGMDSFKQPSADGC